VAGLLLARPSDPGEASGGASKGASSGPTDAAAGTFEVDEVGRLHETEEGDQPDAEARRLWTLFAEIAGDRASDVLDVRVYDDPDDTTMASVARDDVYWHATVNTAWTADADELERTFVHEFGHMLTLSTEQVPELAGACPRFELSEGCPTEGSVVAAFESRFWQGYGTPPADDGAEEDDVTAFFRANGGTDAFVSEYAATNVTEDVAESWMEYVFSEVPADDPARPRTAKLRTFEEFPAMVAERDRIREALGIE
ncbi:MAG: hypothetical protein Q7T71_15040, partial [Herbiconiux sp.]|nr:hypothetical protein [Herbiconiux sp.]